MSYQPQGPQAGVPTDPNAAAASAGADAAKVLEEILGAELPGEGYAFPDDPAKRQAQLIKTTPEFVRANLLRAIEVQSFYAQLPLSEENRAECARLILALSQSYLLLDETLDQNGIPVEGPGSVAHATALAQHQFPPRPQPNAQEEGIAKKNEAKSDALKGTRPAQPRPQPRVGS